jgi:hypothetical protein
MYSSIERRVWSVISNVTGFDLQASWFRAGSFARRTNESIGAQK